MFSYDNFTGSIEECTGSLIASPLPHVQRVCFRSGSLRPHPVQTGIAGEILSLSQTAG